MLEYYRAVPANAEFARLHTDPLPMRVLAVAGARSGSLSLPEALVSRVPRLTAVVFEDTGHYVPEERPLEIATAIAALVAG